VETPEAAERRKKQLNANFFLFLQSADKSCAIVEGFADRSVPKSKPNGLPLIIKNLQPISVGV
jgi:hypothetical protein